VTGNPFEVCRVHVDVRGMPSTRRFSTAPAMTMGEAEKRPAHLVSDGPAQATAGQNVVAHSVSPFVMRNNQRTNRTLCRGLGAGKPLESMRLGIVDVTHQTKIGSNLNSKFLGMNVIGVNNEHHYDETARLVCPLFDH